MAANWGANPWSDATKVVRSRIGQLLLDQPHGGVGALVGPSDEGLPLGDPVVGRAVDLDVVVGRVGGAVGQRRRDEAEELVLELVGDRVADHRQVRLVGVEDVLDQRVVQLSPSRPLARRRSPR